MIRFIAIKVPTNHISARAPSTLVITICPIAPTVIDTTPIIRFRGERKKTRPPYSPIRFGVKTAHVRPQKTDSTAFHILIFSTRFKRYFHFSASKNQFRSISSNSVTNTTKTFKCERFAVSVLKSLTLLLSLNFGNIYAKARTRIAILKIILSIFLVLRFNDFFLQC